MNKMNWKKYLPIIGIILFIYIILKIDISRVVKEICNANIYFILFSIIMVAVMLITQTFKWYVIGAFQGIDFSFMEAMKINLIGNFYAFITPSKIGAVIRAEYLKKYTKNIGKGLCNFTLDKAMDTVSIIFIVIAFSFVFQKKINIPIFYLTMIFFFIVALTLFFTSKNKTKFLFGFVYRRFIPIKMKDKVRLTFDSFYDNMPKKRYFFIFFILNLVNWLIIYWISYLIGLSLGIDIGFFYFLAILPLGTIAAMLPISISGLGTREAILISLFGLFGVDAAKVFSMSLISLFISGIIPAIIGGFFIWKKR